MWRELFRGKREDEKWFCVVCLAQCGVVCLVRTLPDGIYLFVCAAFLLLIRVLASRMWDQNTRYNNSRNQHPSRIQTDTQIHRHKHTVNGVTATIATEWKEMKRNVRIETKRASLTVIFVWVRKLAILCERDQARSRVLLESIQNFDCNRFRLAI